MNDQLLARLGWYVAERQAVWFRRQAGHPRPWTTDKALADNHFTNVYRELDPGTVYAHQVMSTLDSRADRVWFALAYRGANRRVVFEEYEGSYGVDHTEEWLAYVADRYARKLPVKTTRHLTPNPELYRRCLREFGGELPADPTWAWKELLKLPGVGTFIGWQVHCDVVEHGDVDYDPTFVRVGDGAAYSIATLYGRRRFEDYWHDGRAKGNKGRNREIGSRIRVGRNEPAYTAVIRWLVETQSTWLASHWQPWKNTPISVKNMEHALCEWMRWERLTRGVKNGTASNKRQA